MPSPQSVEVDLILPSMRILGALPLEESRRVSDILNTPAESLSLTGVVVRTLEETRLESYPELAIAKRHVLAVMPKEPPGYVNSRRISRFGVTPPSLSAIPVGMVLPPFNGHGMLLMPLPLTLPIVLARLAHFFPLTNSVLYLKGVRLVDGETLLVNRDLVLGLGPLEEGGFSSRRQGAQAGTTTSSPNEALIERLFREARGDDSRTP